MGIKSKFKCRDRVWFMKSGKPVSKYIYQISSDNDVVWYYLTRTCGYAEFPSLPISEENLYPTKKDLLTSLPA